MVDIEWRPLRSAPEEAAQIAARVRARTEAARRRIFERMLLESGGDPDRPGMADLRAALEDLVESHVSSEIEESVTWGRPTSGAVTSAFISLFVVALRAALDALHAQEQDD